MTAVIETIEDLEFIAFLGGAEDPFERPCEATRKKCPNVALYVARYRPFVDYEPAYGPCDCYPPQKVCLSCKDYLMSHPADYVYKCRKCEGLLQLVSIEPIR